MEEWICRDCGWTGEDPHIVREYHGLPGWYESFAECPRCGSDLLICRSSWKEEKDA